VKDDGELIRMAILPALLESPTLNEMPDELQRRVRELVELGEAEMQAARLGAATRGLRMTESSTSCFCFRTQTPSRHQLSNVSCVPLPTARTTLMLPKRARRRNSVTLARAHLRI
jgi:hypothetical protein